VLLKLIVVFLKRNKRSGTLLSSCLFLVSDFEEYSFKNTSSEYTSTYDFAFSIRFKKSFGIIFLQMPKQYNLKYISLVSLILQTTCVVLLLRYSRTKQVVPYISSTAIVASEFIKGLICMILVWFENGIEIFFPHILFLSIALSIDCSFNRLIRKLHEEIYCKPYDTTKLAIPSGLYAIQNNLLFIALSYLNAATYQVSYQLKILTTALCSVFMLGKRIEKHQWFSLCMLAIGVAFVTVSERMKIGGEVLSRNVFSGHHRMMLANVQQHKALGYNK
jgi:multidrug transporter EmrE-like cation transporter